MVERDISTLSVGARRVYQEGRRRTWAVDWSHPGTNNYYRNQHGRVFTVMPWRFVDYWRVTHDPDRTEYESGG